MSKEALKMNGSPSPAATDLILRARPRAWARDFDDARAGDEEEAAGGAERDPRANLNASWRDGHGSLR